MGGGTGSGLGMYEYLRYVKEEISKKFAVNTKNIPLDELVRIESLHIRKNSSAWQKMRDLLSIRNKGYFKKNFRLGKVYAKTVVSGVKEDKNIANLTEFLVYGLISQKPDLVSGAGQIFDTKKLSKARKYVSPKEVYRNIKDDLSNIRFCDDEGSARNILNFFKNRYKNVREISDLVNGIEERKIDFLLARMQQGTLHDLFDNSKLGACTFYPDGGNEEEALNYALDENVGLLHLIPVRRKKLLEPVGAAICLNAEDRKQDYGLLIDSYEQGSDLNLPKNTWIHTILKAIKGVVKDNKAKFIVFNSKALSCDNSAVIRRIKCKTGRKVQEYWLRKIGGGDCLKKYNGNGRFFKYLESFENSGGISNRRSKTEGIVEGVKIEYDF